MANDRDIEIVDDSDLPVTRVVEPGGLRVRCVRAGLVTHDEAYPSSFAEDAPRPDFSDLALTRALERLDS